MNLKGACLICITMLLACIGAQYSLPSLATPEKVSQQEPLAPSFQIPDLQWKPQPFNPVFGTTIRYIDYENGDDRNPGSKPLPWKHHPWDPQATAMARTAKGIDTYIFRKGVVYRGTLVANESGSAGNPIRLTVDPEWGSGEAILSGSAIVKGRWHYCTPEDAPALPADSRPLTWCTEWKGREPPHLLWEIYHGSILRIPLARTPNWDIKDINDPRSEWPEITGAKLKLRLSVEDPGEFSIGDKIWQINETVTRRGKPDQSGIDGNVVEVGADYLIVDLNKWDLRLIKIGGILANGKTETKITAQPDWKEVEPIRLIVPELLQQQGGGNFQNSIIWLESDTQVKPRAGRVIDSNKDENSISVDVHHGPRNLRPYNRYFLEGLPQFLDISGEYAYRKSMENTYTLFLRLSDDRDPNKSQIEISNHRKIITIKDHTQIEISGLTFQFAKEVATRTLQSRHAPMYAAALQIRGSSTHINIHHCHFRNLPAGITAFPDEAGKNNVLDNINITDSQFQDIDGSAIVLGSGRDRLAYSGLNARLIHTKVLRNRLDNIGSRNLARLGAGANGHGIDINGGEIVEIAENHINNVWGGGIALILGSEYERSTISKPLLRGLIHHNKVTDSVLGLQDTGGIGTWMGGPTYIYNNISGNPVGYKHTDFRAGKKPDWYRSSSYGIGIYLDGQYKGYVFNNIVWGLNNNVNDRIYNSVAINEAMGFMNTIFHNTLYRFGVGLHKGMFQHNRSYYIGNLFLDMGHRFILHEARDNSVEYSTLAYSKNVFSGSPSYFGQLGKRYTETYDTLSDWRLSLGKRGAITAETGILTALPVVQHESTLDFRPGDSSAVIDAGARVFVPWALYRVVGEWNFLRPEMRPVIISGENLNMNQEWIHRSMFDDIPRNDLACRNIDASSYVPGILEDWTLGALQLNGANGYCKIEDAELKAGYMWTQVGRGKNGTVTDTMRDTVDIGSENFLIEAVLAPDAGQINAGIVSKNKEKGYAMTINGEGEVELLLDFGGRSCSRASSVPINDGQWHHVIAEIDRESAQMINIYIDGNLANGKWNGNMDASASLANTADFSVGRSGNLYFSGKIDFLRIAKGTLSQAETDIDELYDWEFNGPFLRDFTGRPPTGSGRDAGAVEYYSSTGHGSK